jgi:hypothetical protein
MQHWTGVARSELASPDLLARRALSVAGEFERLDPSTIAEVSSGDAGR